MINYDKDKLRELIKRDLGVPPKNKAFDASYIPFTGLCAKCDTMLYYYNNFCPKCGYRANWGK